MKKRNIILLAGLVAGSSAFGQLINDASFVDQNWPDNTIDLVMDLADGSGTTDRGFLRTIGAGGPSPNVSAGELTISMIGATNGRSRVFSGDLNATTFNGVADYIVTTRMRVNQFADNVSFSVDPTGARGISLFDIRGLDRAYVSLEADSLWVNSAGSWLNVASITTTPGVDYTWQFEMSQGAGASAGTMDIYRRDVDTDPFALVVAGVALNGADILDQYLMYEIRYNDQGTGIQASLTTEYLQIGTVIPEPATLGLVAGAGLLLIAVRRFRM